MRDSNISIKGLWIGKELSPNEVLCAKSYLHHGHTFELYTYDRVNNVPTGVVTKDANQIIPKSEIFTFTNREHKQSLAAFADMFRFKLLYELGGWWSDMDAVCLKPYDLDQDYVFMQEKQKNQDNRVCNGIIKCPVGSPIMKACYESVVEMRENINSQIWTATGPILLGNMVNKFSLNEFVLPQEFFSPVGYYEIDKLFSTYLPGPESYSVHLYNEVWNMRDISKYGVYPKGSLLEKLKRDYSVGNHYGKLLVELYKDLKINGLKKGHKIVYNKLWYMLFAFRTMNKLKFTTLEN